MEAFIDGDDFAIIHCGSPDHDGEDLEHDDIDWSDARL
jgi:hypothetical protein